MASHGQGNVSLWSQGPFMSGITKKPRKRRAAQGPVARTTGAVNVLAVLGGGEDR